MNRVKILQVYMGKEKVGTLAENDQHLITFAYDREWLVNGFSISPFSLPLEDRVFVPNYDPFGGLYGAFADSLPDGWGRLLVDRLLRKEGISPETVGGMERLSIVGDTGMGALTYRPEYHLSEDENSLSLDELARQCKIMFETEESDNLDELFRLGGSSGGARPKVFYQIDGEEWIIKFPASMDREDIGEEEYAYSVCARKCGIEVPETRLLPSDYCEGYYAVKRFDRDHEKRIHMLSVSALLETSHRIPYLDYDTLMQLTMVLTRSFDEIEKLYRQMCFNVFAHNRDDHSRNFTFQYKENRWQLSPAYDLTYSHSLGGEHATMVHGNEKNPGMKDILAVAEEIKLDREKAKQIAEEIQEIVEEELGRWLNRR